MRRSGYASLVANRTLADAKNLTIAWTDFIGTFVGGKFAQDEATELQGNNMLYHAITLYTDKVIKELKVATPFAWKNFGGNKSVCKVDKEPCAEELESRFAHISKENIQRNMVGFDMLYYGIGVDGARGFGFRDLVADKDTRARTSPLEVVRLKLIC